MKNTISAQIKRMIASTFMLGVSLVPNTAFASSDLVIRNTQGDLLLYPFKSETFYNQGGGKKVGNNFNFTHYFVGNWLRNGTPDLIARTKSGDLLLYPFKNGTFYGDGGGKKVGNGWNFTH